MDKNENIFSFFTAKKYSIKNKLPKMKPLEIRKGKRIVKANIKKRGLSNFQQTPSYFCISNTY